MTIQITMEVKDAAFRATMDALIARAKTLTPLHKLFGLAWLSWADRNFRRGGSPAWKPLSPNTIAARRTGRGKGGAQILRDRGDLAKSASYHADAREVGMGFTDRKAPWHHFGTRPRTIVPRHAKMLRFTVASFAGPWGSRSGRNVVFARRVRHPGIPARPLLPTEAQVVREMNLGALALGYLLDRRGSIAAFRDL